MTLEDLDPPPPVNDVNPVKNWAEAAKEHLPIQSAHEYPICEELGIPWTELPHTN